MSEDDRDRTIIGSALPGPGGPAPKPLPSLTPRPMPGGGFGGGEAQDDGKTVIGGALPFPPASGGTDGWGVEAMPGSAPAPIPPSAPAFAPSAYPAPGGFGGAGPGAGFGGPPMAPAGFGAPSAAPAFPQSPPAPAAPAADAGPKIALSQALQGSGLGTSALHNPLLAAAADLLVLLGRLRSGMVEPEVRPLMEHVSGAIEQFETRALSAGVPADEVQIAKYMLCGTADDIVQNIPSTDRHLWMQYSMVARFFNVRTSGVGFFQELEKALKIPAQRANLLEFALVCLSLGFEGQYRSQPNGQQELHRIRTIVHSSLRHVHPRPEVSLSPRWMPVVLERARGFGGVPVLAVAGVVGVLLAGFYTAVSLFLGSETGRISARYLEVVPQGGLTLVRPDPPQVVVMPEPAAAVRSDQSERIAGLLAPEIEAGALELGRKGDYIRLRVNNALLFNSGRVDVLPEFSALAARIAEALNPEPGPIRVQGFTDTDPVRRGGRFKDNFALSQARAEAVLGALSPALGDPARLIAEGKGEAEPLGDNKTAEGKAQNRRVELLLLREELAQP